MQSVSYTHLDVYKRQGMICSMVCIELAALTYHSYSPMESGMMKLFRNSSDIDEKISIQSSATVSYTHLDVYKRQVYIRWRQISVRLSGRRDGKTIRLSAYQKEESQRGWKKADVMSV